MSNHNKNKVTKPKTSNYKTSDRRLASGIRPELFLLSQQNSSKSTVVSNLVQGSQQPSYGTPSKQAVNRYNNNKPKKDDQKLDEWDPKHFRLFVGNLGADANDILLQQAFGKYPSLTKVRVPVDKMGTNKGYGFAAFQDPNDYLKAFKELNGKYIGHNPCVLKKANDLNDKNKKKK